MKGARDMPGPWTPVFSSTRWILMRQVGPGLFNTECMKHADGEVATFATEHEARTAAGPEPSAAALAGRSPQSAWPWATSAKAMRNELERYLLRTFIEQRPDIRATDLRMTFPDMPGETDWQVAVHGGTREHAAEVLAAAHGFAAGWGAR